MSFCVFTLQEGREQGIEYQVSVSYLELYLEDLRDLLDASTNSRDITIREDDSGNTGNTQSIHSYMVYSKYMTMHMYCNCNVPRFNVLLSFARFGLQYLFVIAGNMNEQITDNILVTLPCSWEYYWD